MNDYISGMSGVTFFEDKVVKSLLNWLGHKQLKVETTIMYIKLLSKIGRQMIRYELGRENN